MTTVSRCLTVLIGLVALTACGDDIKFYPSSTSPPWLASPSAHVASSATAALPSSTDNPSFKVLFDWQPAPMSLGSIEGYVAASPDGNFLARIGLEPQDKESANAPRWNGDYTRSLWVKDVATGEDHIMASDVEGFNRISDVSFTPDGMRLIFAAGAGLEANDWKTDFAYTLRVPYGGAPILVANTCGEARTQCDIKKPIVSPDGKQIAFAVTVWEKRPPQYGTSPDGKKFLIDFSKPPFGPMPAPKGASYDLPPPSIGIPVTYVGVMAYEGADRNPVVLTQGSPEFWSSDSRSIYYNDRGSRRRVNIATKAQDDELLYYAIPPELFGYSRLAHLADHEPADITHRRDLFYTLLGKIPGQDAVIVSRGGSPAIWALQPDVQVDADLARAVTEVKTSDSEGNALIAVEPVGNRRLFVRYRDTKYGSFYHAQLLEY